MSENDTTLFSKSNLASIPQRWGMHWTIVEANDIIASRTVSSMGRLFGVERSGIIGT
jgi:hypothetical protein